VTHFLFVYNELFVISIITHKMRLEIYMCVYIHMYTHTHIYVYIYIYTSNRVLLAKFTFPQLVSILGNPNVHYRLHKAHQFSLSWDRYAQSPSSHPVSLRVTLTLSCRLSLCLPSSLLPSGFTRQKPVLIYFLPFFCHIPPPPPPADPSWFDEAKNISWKVQIMTLLSLLSMPPP
jgi:hypothetical protein